MAGYSKTPLHKKLGMKDDAKIVIVNMPRNFLDTLGEVAETFTITQRPTKDMGFVMCFVEGAEKLKAQFPTLKKSLAKDGMLWIAWPKKASKVKTDVDENVVREIGLKCGLVDVKVCAVDKTWSGLKFVYRLEDR